MRPGRADTLFAFAGYTLLDLVLSIGGFARVQDLVRRFPVRAGTTTHATPVTDLVAALDRAALWYPRTRLCLARSAVATCLLRWRGHAAHMVIGARQMPFHAHAWVEVDGQIVTDSPRVRERYRELERM
jgi:hypothetical protein